jgi:hypothetical protein
VVQKKPFIHERLFVCPTAPTAKIFSHFSYTSCTFATQN